MMNEMSGILFDTARRLFDERAGEAVARASRAGELVDTAWNAAVEAGLPLALLNEEQGGFGLLPADAFELLRIGGSFASPIPLGETMVANWLLAGAGLPPADGAATFAVAGIGAISETAHGWAVAAEAWSIPWAAQAETLVLLSGDKLARIAKTDVGIVATTPAGELSRADIALGLALPKGDAAVLPAAVDADRLFAIGALIRAMEMAGALRSVLDIAVRYAGERVQFGKPLAKFQAIQQQLAIVAGEVAVANAAADLAAEAFGGAGEGLAIAVAKSRVGEAAGVVSTIAHQVLGAIGFTEEHSLHLFTRSLWAWREEYGSERYWQRRLGDAALNGGGGNFWTFVTQPALTSGVVA